MTGILINTLTPRAQSFTAADVARLWCGGVCSHTIRNWVAAGKFPPAFNSGPGGGRKLLWARADLEAWQSGKMDWSRELAAARRRAGRPHVDKAVAA